MVFSSKSKDGYLCSRTVTKQITDRQRNGKGQKTEASKSKRSSFLRGVWKPHDLRRTGATLMNALGVLPEVAERCLNHMEENKIKRIYQRYGYETEMRQAWEKLGERLDLLTRATP